MSTELILIPELPDDIKEKLTRRAYSYAMTNNIPIQDESTFGNLIQVFMESLHFFGGYPADASTWESKGIMGNLYECLHERQQFFWQADTLKTRLSSNTPGSQATLMEHLAIPDQLFNEFSAGLRNIDRMPHVTKCLEMMDFERERIETLDKLAVKIYTFTSKLPLNDPDTVRYVQNLPVDQKAVMVRTYIMRRFTRQDSEENGSDLLIDMSKSISRIANERTQAIATEALKQRTRKQIQNNLDESKVIEFAREDKEFVRHTLEYLYTENKLRSDTNPDQEDQYLTILDMVGEPLEEELAEGFEMDESEAAMIFDYVQQSLKKIHAWSRSSTAKILWDENISRDSLGYKQALDQAKKELHYFEVNIVQPKFLITIQDKFDSETVEDNLWRYAATFNFTEVMYDETGIATGTETYTIQIPSELDLMRALAFMHAGFIEGTPETFQKALASWKKYNETNTLISEVEVLQENLRNKETIPQEAPYNHPELSRLRQSLKYNQKRLDKNTEIGEKLVEGFDIKAAILEESIETHRIHYQKEASKIASAQSRINELPSILRYFSEYQITNWDQDELEVKKAAFKNLKLFSDNLNFLPKRIENLLIDPEFNAYISTLIETLEYNIVEQKGKGRTKFLNEINILNELIDPNIPPESRLDFLKSRVNFEVNLILGHLKNIETARFNQYSEKKYIENITYLLSEYRTGTSIEKEINTLLAKKHINPETYIQELTIQYVDEATINKLTQADIADLTQLRIAIYQLQQSRITLNQMFITDRDTSLNEIQTAIQSFKKPNPNLIKYFEDLVESPLLNWEIARGLSTSKYFELMEKKINTIFAFKRKYELEQKISEVHARYSERRYSQLEVQIEDLQKQIKEAPEVLVREMNKLGFAVIKSQ